LLTLIAEFAHTPSDIVSLLWWLMGRMEDGGGNALDMGSSGWLHKIPWVALPRGNSKT
jgi:hypothetical protein